jgi:hypothetical protein
MKKIILRNGADASQGSSRPAGPKCSSSRHARLPPWRVRAVARLASGFLQPQFKLPDYCPYSRGHTSKVVGRQVSWLVPL